MKPRSGYAMVLVPLLIAAQAGCGGSAATVHLNDGVAPGPEVLNSAGIPVYAARTIGRAVQELGSVCVSTQSELPAEEYLVRIRRQAAKIGADAIVNYEIIDGTAMGIAVRYLDRPASRQ